MGVCSRKIFLKMFAGKKFHRRPPRIKGLELFVGVGGGGYNICKNIIKKKRVCIFFLLALCWSENISKKKIYW